MSADQSKQLEAALAEIQKRWGSDAIRPLSSLRLSSTRIPTGFPELDTILGGGIPCGCAIELSGLPSSGKTTLALKIVAEAQNQGRPTVYVDLASLLNPSYAARCGIRMDQFVIGRPGDIAGGLDMLHVVATKSRAGLVVFDPAVKGLAGPRVTAQLNSALRKLSPLLKETRSTAVLLNPGAGPGLAIPHVDLRLHVENIGWIKKEAYVSGLRARVTVVKAQRGRSGQQVELTITLNGRMWEDVA